ncbi:MAG: hypothetical protein HC923_04970 [Myxococcales bacterium]|nr:hypothetical protein [Myxococcales bacterium]
MNPELQLTFRQMDPSPALANLCRERAERLGRLLDGPSRLHVTIEMPHRQHTVGNELRVQLHAVIQGRELLVMESDRLDAEPQPQASAIIREAFSTLERRLASRLAPTGGARRHEAARHASTRDLLFNANRVDDGSMYALRAPYLSLYLSV